jgi:hypothetical protein
MPSLIRRIFPFLFKEVYWCKKHRIRRLVLGYYNYQRHLAKHRRGDWDKPAKRAVLKGDSKFTREESS